MVSIRGFQLWWKPVRRCLHVRSSRRNLVLSRDLAKRHTQTAIHTMGAMFLEVAQQRLHLLLYVLAEVECP